MSERTSASKIFIQEANRWGWMSSAWPCPHIDRPWTTIPRAKEKPVVWTQTVEKTLEKTSRAPAFLSIQAENALATERGIPGESIVYQVGQKTQLGWSPENSGHI